LSVLQKEAIHKRTKRKLVINVIARKLFFTSTLFALVTLAILLFRIVTDGIDYISLDFLTGRLSTDVERAGIYGAILGTAWLMLVVTPVTIVIGVGTAIYLELYAKDGKLRSFLQINIRNLAGVPSIVYGILGLTVFVRGLQLGNVILAGGLTMALLILPITIVASSEALQSVPHYVAEASYGMGATKWQTIRHIILPAALPSIITGAILSLSRAIGETAPLIVIGIPALLIPLPGSLFDTFTVLPVQIYYWTLDSTLVAEYANLAAATIIVLLFLLAILNGVAIYIRNKFTHRFE